jgi:hypothetical protein
VRKFDTDYKKAAPGGRSAPSMFSWKGHNIFNV